MKFGIFDHVDDSGLPAGQHYENRLRLVEAMDRLGAFHSYHVAEHHGTALGLAPSPNLLLAAVAQRTKRLRFGPLVYVAALYHPMRLAEEICMLDQMSGGRLEVGIGRGAVFLEQEMYGVSRESVPKRYDETREVLMQALSSDVVNFKGEHFTFEDFPMVLRPVQKPRPPLWYGIGNPDSAAWAAANDVNVVSLQPARMAVKCLDRYRREWAALGKAVEKLPFLGLARHIVVADTDEGALNIARSAYTKWRSSFEQLWKRRGVPNPLAAALPPEWDAFQANGSGVAGAPATVRELIRAQSAEAHANFMLCQMVFGSMAYDDALRSLELFAGEVAPALAD